jgi:hypothetical protein
MPYGATTALTFLRDLARIFGSRSAARMSLHLSLALVTQMVTARGGSDASAAPPDDSRGQRREAGAQLRP